MIDFSFNNDTQVTNESKRRFAPWDIYNITKVSVEKNEFNGKADPEKVYKTLKVRFENDECCYDENIFYPTPEDGEVQVRTDSNGREFKIPSRWDQTKIMMGQIMAQVSPEGYKKFCAASAKFKNFDMMAEAFMKIINSVKSVDLELKLVGYNQQDGNVYARLPRFVGYRSDGTMYVSNFIGHNLFFTSKEESARATYKNAKPTHMPDMSVTDLTNSSNSDEEMKVDDIDDLDSILNDLA